MDGSCAPAPPRLGPRSSSNSESSEATPHDRQAPSRMLCAAPPAAGPAGTVGRARATPELHGGAVRSGTAGRGLNRDHGPCTGRGGFASTHAHLGTAGRETLWGPRAAGGPEELRDSELSHGCRRDTVTVCFRYLVPQFSEDSTIFSELALLHSESGVELCPRSIKADGEETRQSSYNPNRV
jgi:hypothetical protein